MKHKKTVTDSVLAANRANAKFSTGPRTEQGKFNSGHNTFRHGILAKGIVLETHEERSEFKRLFQQCQDDLGPEGLIEKVLMEEIAITLWKLRIVGRLETRELSLFQEDARDPISGVFHGDLELPIGGQALPIDKGWDCERIIVRAVAGKDYHLSSASCGPMVYQGKVLNIKQSNNQNSQNERQLEVEAVLGSSLDRLTRYQSALKRDLYRAIQTLRSVQAERREHGEG